MVVASREVSARICPNKASLGFSTIGPHLSLALIISWGKGFEGASPVQKSSVLVFALLLEVEVGVEEVGQQEYFESEACPKHACKQLTVENS